MNLWFGCVWFGFSGGVGFGGCWVLCGLLWLVGYFGFLLVRVCCIWLLVCDFPCILFKLPWFRAVWLVLLVAVLRVCMWCLCYGCASGGFLG